MKIIRIDEARLEECLDIIHRSFATVAEEFGLTRENCPSHTSFMPIEKLRTHAEWGFDMFGMEDGGKIIGYVSVALNLHCASFPQGKFEMHNLAVLPEYRHGGIGRNLLDLAKKTVAEKGGNKLHIGIIEESTVLKKWYEANGFVSTGTQKFEHLPFTVGFMECDIC